MEVPPGMRRRDLELGGKLSVTIECREDHRLTMEEFRRLQAFFADVTDALLREILDAAIRDHGAAVEALLKAREERGLRDGG